VTIPRTQPYAVPLIALDHLEVTPLNDGFWVTATKTVLPDDPYLPAHFPGRPIYPGVFVLETLSQAVVAATEEAPDRRAKLKLTCLRSARFLAPLLPGDVLRSSITIRSEPRGNYEVSAECRSEGRKVAKIRAVFGHDEC
jgi:3-hydroxyacyl-[acyl-carrier-protein] dehydratase